jgi:hypothetical protein
VQTHAAHAARVVKTWSNKAAMNILMNESKRCGGDLRKSKLVVKLVEFVNCQPDFYDIPKVI